MDPAENDMNPAQAASPPNRIMGLAPKRSTILPNTGPVTEPSARINEKIREVWVLLSLRSFLMGPKNTPMLWEKMPAEKTAMKTPAASVHQP